MTALEQIYKKAVEAPRVAPGHQEMKMQLVKILGLQSQVDAALGNVLVLDEHIKHLEDKRSGYAGFILKFKKELSDEYSKYSKMQNEVGRAESDLAGEGKDQPHITAADEKAPHADEMQERSRSPSIGRGKGRAGPNSTARTMTSRRTENTGSHTPPAAGKVEPRNGGLSPGF